MPSPAAPPVALSIAGSDNSAGAGIQADLKTFTALGTYGLTAVTCVVAEVPGKVSAIQPIEPAIVAEQIRLSFEAFPVMALKTGMLHSGAIIEVVCDAIERVDKTRRPAVVVDPVMVATSGDPLLEPEAIQLYRERLFPMADLITPNLDEAAVLLGAPIRDLDSMRTAGRTLAEICGAAILLKGGHLKHAVATDLLFYGETVSEFEAPYVAGVSTHGTGCSYAAAIVAGLAKGLSLEVAVGEAKNFITRAITNFYRWNRGGCKTDALNHSA